jgi:hypothetical protein
MPRPQIANVELQHNVQGWVPAEGSQYAELDTDWDGPGGSINGEPATVKIYQDIRTIPGDTYTISFYFSPRPDTDASNNILEVKAGSNVIATISAPGSSSLNWTLYTYNFTATNNVTRLQFADLGTPDSLGVFLDGVSLRCVTIIPPTAAVHPILECVDLLQNGSYIAHFGYKNDNNVTVTIPLNANFPYNKITGGGLAGINQGQPTVFLPGRTPYYPNNSFDVVFDGTNLVWTLTGPDNATRTSTASNNPAQRCVAPPVAAVHPILECVDLLQNGSYVAHFGYQNDNNITVNIPVSGVSPFNKITGGGLAGINQGQPTAFLPGRTPYYPNNSFNVMFDGTNLVWTLTGPDNATRTATASSNSTKCDNVPPTILTYSILPRTIYVNDTSNTQATAIDNVGVKRVWMVFSGLDTETVTLTHQTGDLYTGTFDPLIDGTFHAVVYAEDVSGNIVSVDGGQVVVNAIPVPPNYLNCMNITSFGLVTQPAIIGTDKVRAFLVTDYFCARTVLGLWDYDFYLEINDLNGNPVLLDGQPITYGKYPPAGADVNVYVINRLALWKNELGVYNPIMLSLGVWR